MLDPTTPIVDQAGRPTRIFMTQFNSLRAATSPHLLASTPIIDRNGYPTRTICALLFKVLGKAPNASNQIADPVTGYPSTSFLALVK
ncbi:MAG TPA: hypothetical protein VF501_06690 [Thiobacillus sp.]